MHRRTNVTKAHVDLPVIFTGLHVYPLVLVVSCHFHYSYRMFVHFVSSPFLAFRG